MVGLQPIKSNTVIAAEAHVDLYEAIVDEFVEKNHLLKMIPDYDGLGIFIYNVEVDKVVYVNTVFQKTHELSINTIQRPGMRRLIFSRLHPSDVLAIHEFEEQYRNQATHGYANRVIGIRQADDTYRCYHFLVFNLNIIKSDYQYLRLGIQINMPHQLPQNNVVNAEMEFCKKKINCLSDREQEVLRQIVQGCTDKEVGEALNISPNTAQRHRKNILKKLDFKNTAQLSFVAGKSSLI
ncbi:helix-turn-helix transcriptional regulator [uncultured Carboxylicivirga sp.]|uniref:response regulator transcription factor n=1 Tax=uncultured Carboxylicivirga sp. TaxID=1628156 RepID=UPI0011783A49|nr:helix-turn-helix transcriptional regulator [uncultured Carboxylicivirga sp.]TRX71573.1 hypothetical protein FNN09_06260 [Carboxylicivirga sp. M1479]